MKRSISGVLALLLASTALWPMAAADQGLVVLLFAGPRGLGEGGTLTVHVEAYLDGVAVDLDDLTLMVGAEAPTAVNDSTGKWHASYTITSDDANATLVMVMASASLGAASASPYAFYNVGEENWKIVTRVVNFPDTGVAPRPGSTVVLEARTYLNGLLTDGGPVNFTGRWEDDFLFGTGNATALVLTSERVAAGVYQTTTDIPAGLARSRSYSIAAALEGHATEEFGFFSNPFNVMTVTQLVGSNSASVKAYVGGPDAMADASIALTGHSVSLTPPYFVPIATVSATTDVGGQATLNATWSGPVPPTFWGLVVETAGKTWEGLITVTLGPSYANTSGSFQPPPPTGSGCEVIAQADTTQFRGGETATVNFRVTMDGTPVVGQVPVFYWLMTGAVSSEGAGLFTTDASGNFTMVYVVPASWDFIEDALEMHVFCARDAEETVYVAFGGPGDTTSGTVMQVLASADADRRVWINATYLGPGALTNLQGYAVVVPGNQSLIGGVGLVTGGYSSPLAPGGSPNIFSGSIGVPTWVGGGNYTVLAMVTNVGATNNRSNEWAAGGGTVITLQGPTGGGTGNNGTGNNGTGNNGTGNNGTGNNTGNNTNPPPPPAKGFLPGFEGAGAVAAAAAVALVLGAVQGRASRQGGQPGSSQETGAGRWSHRPRPGARNARGSPLRRFRRR